MDLESLLAEVGVKPDRVLAFDPSKVVKLDMSKYNKKLQQVDLNDETAFQRFVFDQIPEGSVGIGGYGEERDLYRRSELFTEGEQRTIHLGVDIWAPAGTAVFAPLEGKIHSFDNRAFHGDYGPVIILEHKLGAETLYSLYGHLSVKSLEGKSVGQTIGQGEEFAWLGEYAENFHWPPHLHFQLMWDMEHHVGDYPGVCKPSEREKYLANCPDPNALLSYV